MRLKFIFLLFTVSTFFWTCSLPDEGDVRVKVIHEKVEERIAKYKISKQEACKRKVLKEAGAIADSILLLDARLNRDTTGRPLIPEKPASPEIKNIADSIPVEPFFRDSSLEWRNDSLEIKN